MKMHEAATDSDADSPGQHQFGAYIGECSDRKEFSGSGMSRDGGQETTGLALAHHPVDKTHRVPPNL